uniref:thermonuclease family protein n=1 Tax=Falsiroseomonas oryzae TaxID=2766473 RepID=UPI0022EAB59B
AARGAPPGSACAGVRRLRRRLLVLVVGAAAAVLGWGLFGEGSGAPALVGRPEVVDADTLAIGSARVRLAGLDAPEAAQTCARGGVAWACGQDATLALRRFLQAETVRCVPEGRDRFDRILARCWAGDADIGAWLVREGLAVAYTRYSWRYLPEQAEAWWHGRGLWGGSFDSPEDWRRNHR